MCVCVCQKRLFSGELGKLPKLSPAEFILNKTEIGIVCNLTTNRNFYNPCRKYNKGTNYINVESDNPPPFHNKTGTWIY